MVDVEVDGRKYQEMHVDGGAIAQLFLYPQSVNLGVTGSHRERRAYVIRNARLDPVQAPSERRTMTIAGHAISTMLTAIGHNDVVRTYFITQRDGVDFNLAYIGEDFTTAGNGDFDQAYMRALYEYGYRQGRAGTAWHKLPPGLPPSRAVR